MRRQKKTVVETIREKNEDLKAIGGALIEDLVPNLKNAQIEWVMQTRQHHDMGLIVPPKTGAKAAGGGGV